MRTRMMGYGVTLALLLVGLSFTWLPFVRAQGVQIVVNRDGVSVRIAPALGADVIATVPAGTTFTANARSGDEEWLRIDFNGEEAWIGVAVVSVFSGDANTLPIADPRSIPYGGFDAPRSGPSSASSPVSGKLEESGLRLRSGPGTAYIILANPPRYSVFPITGRTANNRWLQINFEGTLGWVTADFVTFQTGSITDLPIDGITADAPPQGVSADDNTYFGELRRLRERVLIARDQTLNPLRAIFTDASLGRAPVCGGYPPRPSDANIPNPLLSAYYPTINPILEEFNSAMANLRVGLDVLIETCGRPGAPQALVSQPVVVAGLAAVNTADDLLTRVIERIDAILPPPVGPDQCLLVFAGRADVLSLEGFGIRPGESGYIVNLDGSITLVNPPTPTPDPLALTPGFFPTPTVNPFLQQFGTPIPGGTPVPVPVSEARDALFVTGALGQNERTVGFCVDLPANIVIRFELVRLDDDYTAVLGFSRLDDPANFFVLEQDSSNEVFTIAPVVVQEAGRYLVVISALPDDEVSAGRFALLITDITGIVPTQASLFLLPGRILTLGPIIGFTDIGGVYAQTGQANFTPTPPPVGVVPPPVVGNPNVACPSLGFTCGQLLDCNEAQACLRAGNFSLDADNDGLACEEAPLFCQGAGGIPVVPSPSPTFFPATGGLVSTPPANAAIPGLDEGAPSLAGVPGLGGADCTQPNATCEQLTSCDEAVACFFEGNTALDPDGDNIPCENVCGG